MTNEPDISVRRRVEKQLAALGTAMSPDLVRDTLALLAPLVARPDPARHRVMRDIAYGPAERHRLDVFTPAEDTSVRPVLVYVHGGGFVGGDKGTEGAAHYGNIGVWAADHGMIGVTINYRLAPDHSWPAGSDDVGRAVAWLADNIPAFGGDPARIILFGQSAGAVHVAGHVAAGGAGVRAAIVSSGLYDITVLARSRFEDAYYGQDLASFAEKSTLAGLIATEIPCLFTVSEHDPDSFQRQAAHLCDRWLAARGRLPRLVYLQGDNHLSPALAFGSAADRVGAEILAFLRAIEVIDA